MSLHKNFQGNWQVRSMHRCKFDEIMSTIDVKLMRKSIRVEETHFRNQSFINKKFISVERSQLYAGGAKYFAGDVSSDKHLWLVPKDDVLNLSHKFNCVYREVRSRKLLNAWPWNLYHILSLIMGYKIKNKNILHYWSGL